MSQENQKEGNLSAEHEGSLYVRGQEVRRVTLADGSIVSIDEYRREVMGRKKDSSGEVNQ